MNVKQLLSDDDAVSPVIGVILMVAITVILAAVIATFVLGLGDQITTTSPQASFSFDWDGSSGGTGELDITHSGGDTITSSDLYIRGSTGTGSATLGGNWHEYQSGGSSDSEITAGNRITVGDGNGAEDAADSDEVGSDGEVDVVWERQDGDSSATLGSWDGPDA
jgi:flagellin-like protein